MKHSLVEKCTIFSISNISKHPHLTTTAIRFQLQKRICDLHCENKDKNAKRMKNAICFVHTLLITETHITKKVYFQIFFVRDLKAFRYKIHQDNTLMFNS